MLRLDHAIKLAGNHAPIVPNMWPSLAERQVAIRRGEVSIVAGMPGAGKSTFALALALRAKCPTLYFSADTHAHTMALRTLAAVTGRDQAQIEPVMETHPQWVSETLKAASHIRWCFDSAPTMQSMRLEIEAYEELYGNTPDLIVIDNLMDVINGEADAWQGMKNLLLSMKDAAREHDTAFVVLHHTSESFEVGGRGTPTPPLRALQGKVGPTPALVLTVSNHDPGVMYVTPVKNRYGAMWPSGEQPTWLGYTPASMQVFDPSERDK